MKKRNNNKKNRNNKALYKLPSLRKYGNFEGAITFLDPHKYIILRYTEYTEITLAAGAANRVIYNLNSIYDPNRSGAGHQPYGYDQLAALYARYRVLKASWVVKFVGSTESYYGVVVPTNNVLNTDISGATSFTTASEVPRARIYVQAPSAPPQIDSRIIGLNDLGGVIMTEFLADDRFEASIGSSPTEIVVLYVGVYNPSGSSITLSFATELSFHVDLHDPILVGGS